MAFEKQGPSRGRFLPPAEPEYGHPDKLLDNELSFHITSYSDNWDPNGQYVRGSVIGLVSAESFYYTRGTYVVLDHCGIVVDFRVVHIPDCG